MDDRGAATERNTRGSQVEGKTTGVVLGLIAGVLGVMAGLIPGLFWLAWILGAIAIAVALPARRRGPADPSHGLSRIVLGAGVAALVLGLINLGIAVDGFNYFTTGDETGAAAALLG